eukprot:CAMPEP_0168808992 /NCGR_PEP_ID=MMETSP0726-20121227/2859_1 /TAXON_ID=265536 /ORGANISM="Amphiprora sp., Strain CCMP467" /LENGTH=852 /DNA_ID=CAMNT_0008860969 /DNA_START=173 /DNA_END=2731 /DNA_ORIENTATION=-
MGYRSKRGRGRKKGKPEGAAAAAAVAAANNHHNQINAKPVTCQFCETNFPSKNKLHVHLREDGCQPESPRPPGSAMQDGNANNTIVKQSLAVLFGYHRAQKDDATDSVKNDASDDRPMESSSSWNEWCGQQLRQEIQRVLQEESSEAKMDGGDAKTGDGDEASQPTPTQSSPPQPMFEFHKIHTQSSVAKLRHAVLQQEPDCPAASDVLILSASCAQSNLLLIERTLRQRLSAEMTLPTPQFITTQPSTTTTIRIHAIKLLGKEFHNLHAERSCTQQAYQYLVPLRWLPDAELLYTWKGSREKPPTDSLQRFKQILRATESNRKTVVQKKVHKHNNTDNAASVETATPNHSGSHESDNNNPTEEESSTPAPNKRARTASSVKVASGRYGQLAAKQKRAWHNFADPLLRGLASPNQEPVWRVVDTCRMVGTVNDQFDSHGRAGENASVVVEVRGDGFLPQQVRRLVGTALAMVHGWIPYEVEHGKGDSNNDNDKTQTNLWTQYFLNPNFQIETVLAPADRLYLADSRFHFEESRTSGKGLFETDICGKVIHLNVTKDDATATDHSLPNEWIQCTLSRQLQGGQSLEDRWLGETREVAAPRIGRSIHQLKQQTASSSTFIDPIQLRAASPMYMDVLNKLRGIVTGGKWPETSVARSSVILQSGEAAAPQETMMSSGKAGSFTVINPQRIRELQQTNTNSDYTTPVPLGNQLFPELAEAIFDLERNILSGSQLGTVVEDNESLRVVAENSMNIDSKDDNSNDGACGVGWNTGSTHCAVNCNAQFTPHVDSGRGAGQSLSVIVGLGDYNGGELMVEGIASDIRYQPLRFNGWTLRHWTNPYQGERFSLVWFTPEPK